MWQFKRRAAPENRATDETVASLINALIGKEEITKAEALQIPTVAACIDMIANAVISLPVALYEEKDGKTSIISQDERLRLLNDDTGDTLTPKQFWKQMIEDYYLSKRGANAYINKQYNKMASLNYVDSGHISLMKNEDPIFKSYVMYVDAGTYYQHEFFRLLRKTEDGCFSKPIIDENPLILSVAYSELLFEEALTKKGGNKKGFLKAGKKLGETEMTALKTAFKNLYSNGQENVVVLNDGIDFKESSNTSVEMQMNENKVTNAGEIMKLFHIPESIIKGKATQGDIDNFIKFCLNPLLVDIECSMNRDLLLESEKGKYYFAFDTKELTRANIKERYEAYQIGLKNHFLQPDEVRNKEDMEPLGIDWIELGLDSVLYNTKTKEIYTPNTNQKADLTKGGEKFED